MTNSSKTPIFHIIEENGRPRNSSDARRLSRLLDLLTDETHRRGYTIGGLDINDLRTLANTTNQPEHNRGNRY